MEFHVTGDHRCRELSIRSCTGTTASDGLGDIMDLRGMLCSVQEGVIHYLPFRNSCQRRCRLQWHEYRHPR